jgi:hypothetical protein
MARFSAEGKCRLKNLARREKARFEINCAVILGAHSARARNL